MMNRALRVGFLVFCIVTFLRPVFGQIAVTVAFGPPALPVYELPPCPAEGYLWTPGYWAWDPDFGYYWVPGTWVLAPEPGFLWTPGWWGWETSGFIFHQGYWATQVGFYGGINYGFGYFGVGFGGGRWDGGVFRYNTAVLNVNTTIIHNTYIDRTVVNNTTINNRVSYNGGEGGITTRPTPEQERVAQERHIPPVTAQQQHSQAARTNPAMRASQNQGKPPIAATSRPGEFSGKGVVAAREAGAPYHAPPNAPPGAPAAPHEGSPAHASDLQPHQTTPSNTGNAKLDEKYEKQQQKLIDTQNQEHQQLQQKQEQEHQQAQQRNYSQQQQQQMEQKHQQQVQQMEQRHEEQMQTMQTRQAPPPKPK
jgi:hypothetical protein